MLRTLSTLLLLPILLPQGLWVRLVTPRLPEPEGARSGNIGDGENILNVLIIGDSAAAGVGVMHQRDALSGHLTNNLSNDFNVSWRLEAATGHTTKDAIESIKRLSIDTHYDVVITSLGVNDVTSSISPNEWYSVQKELLELLKSKLQAKHVFMTSVPPMHLFPALPQPLRWCLGLRASDLNKEMQRLVEMTENCYLVLPEFELDSNLMASDGFHPGPELYRHWAEVLSQRINRLLLE